MVVLLLLTHIFFSITAPFKWLAVVWCAGYFITFIGTITLGIVAWWQNEKIRAEANK